MLKNFALMSALVISPVLSNAQGSLENPASGIIESGISIISGWHCSASKVDIYIDEKSAGYSLVSSSRGDTASICGKSDTGFSFLINYNELTPGAHNIKTYADGVKFGDVNFNATQSGGTAFLQNASKSVVVSDFPSSGRSATLQWSQSKQSFIVTSVSSPAVTPTPLTGLSKLYGTITLKYSFSGGSTIFTDTVRYGPSNVSGENIINYLTGSSTKGMVCRLAPAGSYEFMCLISNVSNGESSGRDFFLLDVSSNSNINGSYEYCQAYQSTSTCSTSLLLSPDGTVLGNVNKALSSISALGFSSSTASTASNGDIDSIKQAAKQIVIESGSELLQINQDATQVLEVEEYLDALNWAIRTIK